MTWMRYSDKYEVSSDGHIRNSKTKRILHEFVGKDGYMRTQFDGKTRLIHRVVASIFIDNPDNLPEVNHIDCDKQNNSIDNLEWCSRNYNQKHAYSNGLRSACGIHNSRCKLSIEDVEYIKKHYIKGDKIYGAIPMSKQFNVAHQTICAIISGQNWKEGQR